MAEEGRAAVVPHRDNTRWMRVYRFYDKVPLKYAAATEEELRAGGARIVPHALVRRGAYIAPNVVLMPSYVNIGAWSAPGPWSTLATWGRARRSVATCTCRRVGIAGARAAAGQSDHHRG